MNAATVTALSGKAFVVRGGQITPLKSGDLLDESDIVHTEADTKVSLRFADNSIIELGPDTRISINEFAFDPAAAEPPAFGLHMMGGMVRSISGKIVEQNPESFKLTSPMGAVGIRGTETMHILEDGREQHVIMNIGPHHSVIVSDHQGNAVVLTRPGQGVGISALEGGSSFQEFDAGADWFEQFLGDLQKSLGEQGIDGRVTVALSEYTLPQAQNVPLPENITLTAVRAEDLQAALDTLQEGLAEGVPAMLTQLSGTSSIFEDSAVFVESSASQSTGVARNSLHPGAGADSALLPDVPTTTWPSFDPAIFFTLTPYPTYGYNNHIQGDSGDNILIGYAMNDTIRGGSGNDVICGGANIDGSGTADILYGGFGHDYILKYGRVDGNNTYGDEYNLFSGQQGGNDSIEIHNNPVTGAMVDPAAFNGGNIYGEGNALFGARGGNDTIRLAGDMNASSHNPITNTAEIYGDARNMLDHSVGGNDHIIVDGALGQSVRPQAGIYGDGEYMNNGTAGGDDTIDLGGNLGGKIYGDASIMENGNGGDDAINVGGNQLPNAAIYGDAYRVTGNWTAGNNSITVDGSVQGASSTSAANIYGNTEFASGSTPNPNAYDQHAGNSIRVGTLGNYGSIYATDPTQSGNSNTAVKNRVDIQNFDGGDVYTGGHTNVTIENLGGSGTIHFDGSGNYEDRLTLNNLTVSGTTTLNIDAFANEDIIDLSNFGFTTPTPISSTILEFSSGSSTLRLDFQALMGTTVHFDPATGIISAS